jgi:hypothetical protein
LLYEKPTDAWGEEKRLKLGHSWKKVSDAGEKQEQGQYKCEPWCFVRRFHGRFLYVEPEL